MVKIRHQYAHPDRFRQTAEAKPRKGFLYMDPRNKQVRWVEPRKVGGERSKYTPHQGKREMERRKWQIITGRG